MRCFAVATCIAMEFYQTLHRSAWSLCWWRHPAFASKSLCALLHLVHCYLTPGDGPHFTSITADGSHNCVGKACILLLDLADAAPDSGPYTPNVPFLAVLHRCSIAQESPRVARRVMPRYLNICTRSMISPSYKNSGLVVSRPSKTTILVFATLTVRPRWAAESPQDVQLLLQAPRRV